MSDSPTLHLLRRWHSGDQKALDALIERDLPWIRAIVSKRLGPLLRARGETEDYVQDAMVRALSYGPSFLVSDQDQFRALLARIVENTLRDQHDFHAAEKRGAKKQIAPRNDSVITLDPPAPTVQRPSKEADGREQEAFVRLALELLDPEDRKVILLREWEELGFPDVAARLGITESGARMRFNRALPKLAEKVRQLRSGGLSSVM